MSTAKPKKTIDGLLLEKNLLDAHQLEKARNIQAQTLERLEDILLRMGFLSEPQVLALWADLLGTEVVDLTDTRIDAKLIAIIPEYLAKQHKVIPLKKDGNKLTVAMADPFDLMATDMVSFLTQCRLEVVIAPRLQVEDAIKQLFSWEGFQVSGEESFAGADGEEIMRRTSEEGPVVQFLNAIFKQAIQKRASDIHIEPREDILLIRFRIDGVLHDMMTGPKSLVLPLISRVKILSHLDIAEKRLPQDGRLKVRMEGHDIDFRVSTVPSLLGEKAVLRLLQREAAFELDNIGFLPDDLDRVKEQIDEPYGLVLVTGPTGAGKTTTLFGMLKHFNNSQINIFTIENPIEYRIDGITQVQTNEKIGLDFAMGLRAALRQDPDVILVGEIRDLETAEISFRASLTGHKVLSTLHTNNAPSSITRLINMGVPAYLVTAAVRMVIAQKLLHRICPHCKKAYRPTQKTIARLKLVPSKVAAHTFYKGVGCKECNQTGAYGRLGVYETMVITDQVRDAVMEGGTEQVIRRVAKLNGMKTMREIAVMKAFEDQTTLEEVLCVTSTDEDDTRLSLSSVPASLRGRLGAGLGGGLTLEAPTVVVAGSVVSGGQPGTGGGSLIGAGPAAAMGGGMAMPGTAIASPGPGPGGYGPAGLAASASPFGGATVAGIDPADPVFKSVLTKLADDFLFFTDDGLAERFQLNRLQVQECLAYLGLVRNREAFLARFGRYPEEMGEDGAAETVRTVLVEKRGRLPDFLFAEPVGAELFARALTAQALRLLSERSNDPERLPLDFTADFCREAGLEQALQWAGGDRHRLVELALPGRYQPWQFDAETWLAAAGDDPTARLAQAGKALAWFVNRESFPRDELPSRLTLTALREAGLEPLLARFGGSPAALAEAVFPGQYQVWEFPDDEARLWFREDRLQIAAQATQWLVEKKLAVPLEEVPRRLSLRDFHQQGLGKLLDLFNQSLPAAIDNAFPGRFQPWEYADQTEIWRGEEALATAQKATFWLVRDRLHWEDLRAIGQLTRRHFVNHGLGLMLGALFNHSPFLALENAWASLKGHDPFERVLLQFTQDWRDVATRWAALADKAAVALYGKVRFKVALPNLKIAPMVPESERIYYNSANQIEYMPQIVAAKMSVYDDYSEVPTWVSFTDQAVFWVLADDRAAGAQPVLHPKARLVFAEGLAAQLRQRNLADLADKIMQLKSQSDRLMDRKAPAPDKMD